MIVVTGGAGFIGSHLVDALIEEGNRVVVIDDLSTGSIHNLSRWIGCDDLHLVVGDAADPGVTARWLERASAVYHLASPIGVELVTRRSKDSILQSYRLTESVLNLVDTTATRVFIASSSEVYGQSQEGRARKEDDVLMIGSPTVARWSYAVSKLVQESLALAYWREEGMRVVIGRLFNIIGPRQRPDLGMVVPKFVQQALSGRPITVYGDGLQRRCFMDVRLAVDAMIQLMNHPDSCGEIVNIGNAVDTPICSLAKLIKEVAASDSAIVHVPITEVYPGFADIRFRMPELTKLTEYVGCIPATDLTSVCRRVIEWMADQKEECLMYEEKGLMYTVE